MKRSNGSLDMKDLTRVWIGFFVAPAVPAALLYLWGLQKGYADASIVGPVLLMPFAYAAALILGWPALFLLKRTGNYGLGAFLLMGAMIGLAVVLVMFCIEALLNWGAREHLIALLQNSIGYIGIAMIYATVAGSIFWLIAVRRS